MNDSLLKDQTALVTGGGTGIGKATAAMLADAGAKVTICGPELDVLEAAAEEMRAENAQRQLVCTVCDVTDEAQVAEAVKVAAQGGGLDIAVANAGTGFPGSVLHLNQDHWMVPLGVNLLGTAYTIKHAGLNMKDHGGGAIVTVSSVASARPTKFMAAYGVSKAAIEELTRTAAAELGGFDIRINCIRPGFIQTESLLSSSTEENIAHARRETALSRLGEGEDIARAVLYFTSSQSEWVTGQVMGVCGGFTLIPESLDTEHVARMLFPEEMDRDFGPAAQ